jgi:hypothetical protein
VVVDIRFLVRIVAGQGTAFPSRTKDNYGFNQ